MNNSLPWVALARGCPAAERNPLPVPRRLQKAPLRDTSSQGREGVKKSCRINHRGTETQRKALILSSLCLGASVVRAFLPIFSHLQRAIDSVFLPVSGRSYGLRTSPLGEGEEPIFGGRQLNSPRGRKSNFLPWKDGASVELASHITTIVKLLDSLTSRLSTPRLFDCSTLDFRLSTSRLIGATHVRTAASACLLCSSRRC